MSNKQSTKQRRAAQNKREREARAARVARAGSGSGTRSGSSSSSRTATGTRTKGGSAAAPTGTTRGRTRADRVAARRDRWRDADSPNPGARSVLLGFLMAIGAAAMLLFLPVTPVDRDPGRGQEIETTSLLSEPDVGTSLVVLAVPIFISGAAWFATRWPERRRRVYIVAATMQGIWVVLSAGGPGLLFTVSAVALALGAWQAHHAEQVRTEENADGEWAIDS